MNPITCYTTVQGGSPAKLFGQFPQQNTSALTNNYSSYALWLPAGYRGQNRGDQVGSVDLLMRGLALGSFKMQNRSGGASVMGLATRIPNEMWVAGQWTSDAFVDDTVDAQDTDDSTPDFVVESATNNNGAIFASAVPFNVISARIGTASADAGNAQTRTISYSNAAGTGWQTLTIANVLYNTLWPATGNTTATTTLATEAILAFVPPTDWGKVVNLGGIKKGTYALKLQVTDQPGTTLMSLDEAALAYMYFGLEPLADNAVLEADYGSKDFAMGYHGAEAFGEGLYIFQNTVSEQSPVWAQVRNR